jgi:hypothetical protein
MNPKIARTAPLLLVAALAACTSMPTGPSVMVLPGTGKSFDQFRADDVECRQFAASQTGTTANNAAADSGVRSAAVGTLLGAAAGAAINGGRGAGVGAGAGLAMGGLAGTGAADTSARGTQHRYDVGYLQCMYAKGHRVPVSGQFMPPSRSYYQEAPAQYAAPRGNTAQPLPPPPPPGSPPPPPPGAR